METSFLAHRQEHGVLHLLQGPVCGHHVHRSRAAPRVVLPKQHYYTLCHSESHDPPRVPVTPRLW